jgi:hypothetical protein
MADEIIMASRKKTTPITIVPAPARLLFPEYAMAKPIAIMIKKINTEKELLVFITISSNYLISYKSDVLSVPDASSWFRSQQHPGVITNLDNKLSWCNNIISLNKYKV